MGDAKKEPSKKEKNGEEMKKQNKTKPRKKRMNTFLEKNKIPIVTKACQQWRARSLQECNNKNYLKEELEEFQGS
jgi:hypothetical protein